MRAAIYAVVPLAAALMPFACSPGADDSPVDPPVPQAAPPTNASLTAPPDPDAASEPAIALPGEYRVAGVNGVEIDQPYAITAVITADRIHLTADCLNFAWSYTARGKRIATDRVGVESCARGLTAAEQALVDALDSATTVLRTPSNAIELRGGGRSVTLFSQ